jgi:protein AIR1/2
MTRSATLSLALSDSLYFEAMRDSTTTLQSTKSAFAIALDDMPLPVDSETNESRTQALGVKRSLATSQGAQEGTSTQPQRKKQKNKEYSKDKQKLAKAIGERYSFDSEEYKYLLKSNKAQRSTMRPRRRQGLPPLRPVDRDTAGIDRPQANGMSAPSTNDRGGPLAWNQGGAGTIRTSLRGNVVPAPASKLGNNRLATGFVGSSTVAAPSPESLESGETHSSPIEISSDEEEGGLLINVEGQATPEVISVDSDSEDDSEDEDDYDDEDDDEEMEDGEEDERAVVPTSISSPAFGDPDAHMQLQGDLERHLSNDFEPLSINAAIKKRPLIRLADLSADELEDQYKYCFYGMARDQIDINRPVICIECLQEGHMQSTCPEKYCSYNHGQQHSKLQCPQYRRCTKCRERGHDALTCKSKLKQAVVCDFCSSNHHVESECSLRFFPSTKPAGTATMKLWISCCNCASKSHLVGDCQSLHPDTGPRWSLRNLPVEQINNLSLQSGISSLEKAAESRNMRPQGRDIRPAKRQHRPQAPTQPTSFDEYEGDAQGSFVCPPIPQQNQTQGQKGKISISLSKQPTHTRYPPEPPPQTQRRSPDPRNHDRDRYDRYEAPSTNNRSRGTWYESDSFGQRRRSRSPDPDHYGGDSYRPKSYGQDQRRGTPAGSVSLGERVSYPPAGGGGYDRGPPGAALDSYRPGAGRSMKSTYQGQGSGQPQSRRGARFQ